MQQDTGMAFSFAYSSQIGSFGGGNDQFNNPWQLSGDGTYLWIGDQGNNRFVQRLVSNMSYVAQKTPVGVVTMRGVCSDGTFVYITDSDVNSGGGFGRVQKYDIATLTLQVTVVSAGFGTPGVGPNTFAFPWGICTDGTHVWVADSFNSRVLKLRCSDLQYVSVYGTGTNGAGDNDLAICEGVAQDGTYLYVMCTNTRRVTKMLLSSGAYVAKYGTGGSGDNNIGSSDHPNVSVSPANGLLYVADAGNDRIVVRNTSDLSYVTQFGSTGSGDDQFDLPNGAYASGGFVTIMDSGFNGRLVRYTVTDDTPLPGEVGTFPTHKRRARSTSW